MSDHGFGLVFVRRPDAQGSDRGLAVVKIGATGIGHQKVGDTEAQTCVTDLQQARTGCAQAYLGSGKPGGIGQSLGRIGRGTGGCVKKRTQKSVSRLGRCFTWAHAQVITNHCVEPQG